MDERKEEEKDEKKEMEVIPNNKRGCGYLKVGSYLRADLSPDGTLPPFVKFTTPLPYLEQHFRGHIKFNGLQFELANNIATDPEEEIENTLQKLKHCETEEGTEIENVAESKSAWSTDILMWIGEKYYSKPEKFIEEAEKMGVNKRITKGMPPLIMTGKTKLYLIHPKAIDNKSAGIIGYTYLTRVIFCTDKDTKSQNPKWVNDLNKLGLIDIVKIGTQDPNDETQKRL